MCSTKFATLRPFSYELLTVTSKFRLYQHLLEVVTISDRLAVLPFGIVVRHLSDLEVSWFVGYVVLI